MCWVEDDDAHVVDDCQTRCALGEEGCQPHVALVVEDSHCLRALGELVEELVELDVAGELDIFIREFLREVLLHVHELVGLG